MHDFILRFGKSGRTVLTVLIFSSEMIKSSSFDTFADLGGNTPRVCSEYSTLFRGVIVLRRFLTVPQGVVTF